jgi:Protein of unknown function (DUF2630)
MTDDELMDEIERLEGEERRLRAEEEAKPGSGEPAAALERVVHELDRLWDLKRQRAALAEAGRDPDEASIRDVETVETYEQ